MVRLTLGTSRRLGAAMSAGHVGAGAAAIAVLPAAAGVAVLLVLAWKIAGYYGLDFYLLNWLGTPWRGHLPDADSGSEPAYKTG